MRVSVCMATCNGERFVKEQLVSILCQLGGDDELVISDDSSTDSTLDIINSFRDERIKIYHSTARNFKKNFCNALEHASGDYIFLSDQDDIWLPGKVDHCLAMLQNNDLVVHDCKVTDENLQVTHSSFFRFINAGKGLLKNSIRGSYYGCCMAFQRHLLRWFFPVPATKDIAHDLWLGLVAEIVGKVIFLPEPLLLYRRHQNSLTELHKKIFSHSQNSFMAKVIRHLHILITVLNFKISFLLKS